MTWIQTRSGLAFDLLDPKPEQITIGDIAFALSHLNRFTGHVGTYSVAQHSVLVSRRVAELGGHALCGLLHDAHEAYLGDLSSPVKSAFRKYTTIVDEIDEDLKRAIELKFGLCDSRRKHSCGDLIKQADLELLATEKTKFMPLSPRPWIDLPGPLPIELQPWDDPQRAKAEFQIAFVDAAASSTATRR